MPTSNFCACIAISIALFAPAFTAAPVAAETVADLLPKADLKKGEKAFKKCKACHTVERDGKKKTGPNLFGIVGGPVAANDGFKYSSALTGYGGDWSVERLDAFLTKPKAEVNGTKMTFKGMKKPSDRANVITYLNTFSDHSLSFDDQTTAGSALAVQETEEAEFGILFVAPGVEETFYACSTCHSEMIVAQQGLTRDGWLELFEWMVEEQGQDEMEEPDRTIILDYLTEHYGTDRPNFPKRD